MRKQLIERLLPAAYQRADTPGGVLDALLAVMERLHAPSEEVLAHGDDLVSAYRAPERLLPYLTAWVAWDHLGAGGLPPGRQRELVANAASLAAARGTSAGLTRLLATVTGVDGFTVDEPADRAFHLVVRVPDAAAGQIELVRRVVAAEKPAATTCEVVQITPDKPAKE
jgi:phage tail-like protein